MKLSFHYPIFCDNRAGLPINESSLQTLDKNGVIDFSLSFSLSSSLSLILPLLLFIYDVPMFLFLNSSKMRMSKANCHLGYLLSPFVSLLQSDIISNVFYALSFSSSLLCLLLSNYSDIIKYMHHRYY